MSRLGDRALGVAVGLVLDRLLGEPPDRLHPVAWFGTAMQRVEQVLYADSRPRGTWHAALGVGLGVTAGGVLRRSTGARGSQGEVLSTAVAVWLASAGRLLRDTAGQIEDHLRRDDLTMARERLPWLAGRDPSELDASGVAAAVVESLAENTVDAVLAPAFWGLVGGAPGALAHRASNTLDAMVGHHSVRYERYGWASARLDDVLAWAPARAFPVLLAGCTPRRARQVVATVRRDAGAHPSPNAGVAESALAGALGVKLGGPLRYGERTEDRPRLGDGPRPRTREVTRARVLVDRVELAAVGLCLLTWWADRRTGRRGPGDPPVRLDHPSYGTIPATNAFRVHPHLRQRRRDVAVRPR
ncbi:adenosylcobinamide-phosphate synthase CbiB [Ornithinimicrobium cavernae]|uniref:adenosylcobinamide-phosphate synthase CbiB n=1 Tax=Ornithinimicrobium cavernae TaxID=2666047 RepID=UPI000D687707|nr:adenosylcobinamide-phosphate synthase CbiB [Ornithinimicrobium cavernae]